MKTSKIIMITSMVMVIFAFSGVFGEDENEQIKFNKINIKNTTKYNIQVLVRSLGSEEAFFDRKVLANSTETANVKDGDFNKVEYIQLTSPDAKFTCKDVNCNTMKWWEDKKTVKYTVSETKSDEPKEPKIKIFIEKNKGEKEIEVTVRKDYDKHEVSIDITK